MSFATLPEYAVPRSVRTKRELLTDAAALQRRLNDAMAAFNSMPTMPTGAPNDGMHGMQAGSGQHELDMPHFDQSINFDEALLYGSESPAGESPPLNYVCTC